MSQGTNIILCSDNRRIRKFMDDIIDSSDISQYKLSTLKEIPSNIKNNNKNIVILEISETSNGDVEYINEIESNYSNIDHIYLVNSKEDKEIIPSGENIQNCLFKPYSEKKLREVILNTANEMDRKRKDKSVVSKSSTGKKEKKSAEIQKSFIDSKELLENSPQMIFTIEDNRITYCNRTAAETLKYTKDEMLELNPDSFISEADLEKISKLTREKNRTAKNIKKIRTSFTCKDNEPVEVVGEIKQNKDSETLQFYFSNAVLNEDQNGDEILRLAAAVKSLNTAVTITDTKKEIIYVNPAHREMFGYEPSELIGKSSAVLYPSQDPSGISEKIYEAIFLVGWQGERIAVRKNGDVFQIFEKTVAIKDKYGKESGIVSVHDDISKRKRLEQALKESEKKYRTLIETASTAIIAVDDKGAISIYNPAAESLFQYTGEEAKNRNISTLISEDYSDIFKKGFSDDNEKDILDFIQSTMEISGVRKNGEEFPLEVSVSKCRIEGRLVYTFIIFDITERKNLEQQVLQSAKLAAVGELVSGVTHEVNNPLAVVLGYSEMLLQEHEGDEELSKIIRIIYNESERARKVIQNLLSFARQHNPDKEQVFVNSIIDNTLSLADYELRKHGVKVEKNYESKLPAIHADPNQLQQVFLNLIINAQHAISDHKKSGNIRISTSIAPDGKHNLVCIEDDGPGIPEKIKEKIFDPFFTTKPVGKGTGLGLSVSFGIIDKHSGEMTVESEEGSGTKFLIKLPVKAEKNGN